MKLFIDGASGTVGSRLRSLLSETEFPAQLISLPDPMRKNEEARKAAMAEADLVVLCVPRAEAGAAALMCQAVSPKTKILDASAYHRCRPDWVYGLEELNATAISDAQFVANPGCLATGCILLANGLRHIPRPDLMIFHGVTGYSAAGHKEASSPWLAQFGQAHRHTAEVQMYGQLKGAHITTVVGPWAQGMLVQTCFESDISAEVVASSLQYQYPHLEVQLALDPLRVPLDQHNQTNDVTLLVSKVGTTLHLGAVYDNLGKGAAGAALVNIKRMWG